MSSWQTDKTGLCWKECKAFTEETGLCENLVIEAPLRKPCPLLRIRFGLGREKFR
jgi:hypothetical protein